MNVGKANARTDDFENEDSLQEILSESSLHIADNRYNEYPSIARLGAAIACIEIFLILALVVASFVLPHAIGEETVKKSISISIYGFMMYSHSVVWFIVFIFDLIFSVHHRKLKMKGYLRFYRSVKYLQRHPFCVKSLFQTSFLALTTHLSFNCTSIADADCHLLSLSPLMWIQVLSSIEAAVMILGLVIYLFRVYYQNKYRLAPDDAEDRMLTSFHPHNLDSSIGIGYRSENRVDDIMEHQADQIRSLQEQNSVLNRKLHSLTSKTTSNPPRH